MHVGAETPSPWLYPARAPIHPKRPYGLTRPVVPPDGSSIFGASSSREPRGALQRAKKNPGDYGLRGKVVMLAGQAKSFPQNILVIRF
jgi:hypothetical protein